MWCNGFAEIYARSAMRCAKCSVAVLKASMLNLGGQSAIGICALFYIHRSAIRCTKFGVVVFKASMLDSRGGQLPYADVHCSIYM